MSLQIAVNTVVHPFNFYLGNKIHQGMTFQGKLYQLLREFEPGENAKAYILGCKLSAKGMDVVLTNDGHVSRIWVDLRPERGIKAAKAIASALPGNPSHGLNV
jgi:hypothetical protein